MRLIVTSCLLIACGFSSFSQEKGDSLNLTEKQQFNFIQTVQRKVDKLQKKISSSIQTGIRKLQQQESRLIKKMAKTDSSEAKRMLTESSQLYNNLQKTLQEPVSGEWKEYIPSLDSFQTSIHFLGTGKLLNEGLSNSILSTSGKISHLANSFQTVAGIQQQLKERKVLLLQQFQQFGLVKELKRLNKELFYCQQQFAELKSLLSDGSKLERKVLGLLRESDAFKTFFQSNSQFNSLFSVGPSTNTANSTGNLQSIADVQAMLQGSGMDNMAVTNALSNAQSEPFTNAPSVGLPGRGEGGDLDMPDFSPNHQRTKSFFQRVELGWNLQTKRATNTLPAIADIGLSIGYKLNDNSIIGTGIAYKLGMGNGWKDIRFSHQGVGLRTYMEIRIKGGLWLSGGYEKNYMQAFQGFPLIKDWQISSMLGLTKKYKIGNKKEQKFQVLFDLNHIKNGTQPIQLRYGTNL